MQKNGLSHDVGEEGNAIWLMREKGHREKGRGEALLRGGGGSFKRVNGSCERPKRGGEDEKKRTSPRPPPTTGGGGEHGVLGRGGKTPAQRGGKKGKELFFFVKGGGFLSLRRGRSPIISKSQTEGRKEENLRTGIRQQEGEGGEGHSPWAGGKKKDPMEPGDSLSYIFGSGILREREGGSRDTAVDRGGCP